jgi:nanoRNase/pAp phosphatase (c-di-AMP/oligoRNAs hydrolase)
VGLSLSSYRSKISVGSNPWSQRPRTHNLAALCERYGGGGHPVVGAISFPPEELPRAREIAREIVRELRSES